MMMNAIQRERWLAERRTGIGGSDVAAILGLSPWRSAVDVYLDKIGAEDAPPQVEHEHMYWGNVLEDVVATEYTKRTTRAVQRVRKISRHPQHAWMLGNFDRAVVAPASRVRIGKDGWLLGASGLLECKTGSEYSTDSWFNDEGADAVPVYYAAQGMWYLAIAGLDWCDFAALIGGQRFLTRRLERNEDAIRGMIEQAGEFWHKHVLGKTPPPPASARDVISLFPRDAGDMLDVSQNADALALVNQLRAERTGLDAAKHACEAIEEQIKLEIGAHSGLALDGVPLVTWKAAKDGQDIDWPAIVAEAKVSPDLISKHTTTKPGSRRFLLKGQR